MNRDFDKALHAIAAYLDEQAEDAATVDSRPAKLRAELLEAYDMQKAEERRGYAVEMLKATAGFFDALGPRTRDVLLEALDDRYYETPPQETARDPANVSEGVSIRSAATEDD